MIEIKEENCFVHDIGLLIKCDDWEQMEQQILQDHEDAKYWHKWVGNQSLQEILDVWKKDRQIVKKIYQQYKLRDDGNINDVDFFLNIGKIIGEFDG